MVSLLPIGAELTDFVFSRARRADNASEVADCDLHIASWEGPDFGYGRRQASIGVHSDGRCSVHFGAVSREGSLV